MLESDPANRARIVGKLMGSRSLFWMRMSVMSVVHLKQQFPVIGVSKIGCNGQEIDFAYEVPRSKRLWPEVPVVRENRWTDGEMPSIFGSHTRAGIHNGYLHQPEQTRAVTAGTLVPGPPLLKGVATCQS